jgi:hypothetical protein
MRRNRPKPLQCSGELTLVQSQPVICFAFSSSAAQTHGSKARSSASAATASQLLAIKGCVYAGVHRRETITDVKFSPCARCVS